MSLLPGALQISWLSSSLLALCFVAALLAAPLWDEWNLPILSLFITIIPPIVIVAKLQRSLGPAYGLRVPHWIWPVAFAAIGSAMDGQRGLN